MIYDQSDSNTIIVAMQHFSAVWTVFLRVAAASAAR